jgi:hypothetical protein
MAVRSMGGPRTVFINEDVVDLGCILQMRRGMRFMTHVLPPITAYE